MGNSVSHLEREREKRERVYCIKIELFTLRVKKDKNGELKPRPFTERRNCAEKVEIQKKKKIRTLIFP